MSKPTSRTAESGTQMEADRRGEDRQATCTRCELWVFDGAGEPLRISDAVTRNSSFCGLSMVARLPEPLHIGQPMEAMLASQDKGMTHVAGTVAFCRPVKGDYYEVGVHVKAAGPYKILPGNPVRESSQYDWFTEALMPGKPD